ncbi:hypothetical protein HNY73_005952 [Argiope bruennichi]|uniref:Uncharacterized protein n=1 Tax=Argiope bruennichi TaxID=94029 RepID=A0A8T0FKW4_ARGBR|nr:hypothetical protein HNY73_005952 [Argiope bruennichi]
MASNIVEADAEEIELSTKDVSSTTVSVKNGSDSTGPTQSDSASSITTKKKSDLLTSDLQKVAESNSTVCKEWNARRLSELMIFDLQSLKGKEVFGPEIVSVLDYIERKVKLNEDIVIEFREFSDEVVSVIQHVETTGTSHLPLEYRTFVLINLIIVRQEITLKVKWLSIAKSNIDNFHKNVHTMGFNIYSPHLNRLIILLDKIKMIRIALKSFIKNLRKSADVASTIIECIKKETGVKVEIPPLDISARSSKN